jgi:putative addiction module killer protein
VLSALGKPYLQYCRVYATMECMYKIELFMDDGGVYPFRVWLNKLKDERAIAKILASVQRASEGNFGDWKRIENANGLYEMREHYGAGFRIYYRIINKNVLLILAGSTKHDQNKTIEKAKYYLAQLQRRETP